MRSLFYTTYINVDLAHSEIFRAKAGKGGIKKDNLIQWSIGLWISYSFFFMFLA